MNIKQTENETDYDLIHNIHLGDKYSMTSTDNTAVAVSIR